MEFLAGAAVASALMLAVVLAAEDWSFRAAKVRGYRTARRRDRRSMRAVRRPQAKE